MATRMNRSTPPPPQGDRRYLIPPLLLRGAIDFHTSWLPPEELYAEAQDRGLWQDRTTRDALTCRSVTACRPLLSLRKGHLTRLIPAGLLNNQVLVQGTAHWIIKGRAKKQTRELPPITEEAQTKDGPKPVRFSAPSSGSPAKPAPVMSPQGRTMASTSSLTKECRTMKVQLSRPRNGTAAPMNSSS
jgi:hypothetical protein